MTSKNCNTPHLFRWGLTLVALTIFGSALANGPKPQKAKVAPDREGPVLVPTNRIVAQLTSGAFAQSVAAELNLAVVQNLKSSSDWVVFEAFDVASAKAAEAKMAGNPFVVSVANDSKIRLSKFSFVPNDPFFAPSNGNPDGQWHLRAFVANRPSANLPGAWETDATGQGVTIGIVDDAYDREHPDLKQNFSASLSYSFAYNSSDPRPRFSDETHGTSVSGVAGARGGNGIGVTGAAPFATMAGLQISFDGDFISKIIDATLHFSSGNLANRRIAVKNHSYGFNSAYIPVPQIREAFEAGARVGTIHVLAAGNSRQDASPDTNAQMMTASPDVIVVAGLGSNNKFVDYSSFGASVTVTAPTSDNIRGITTTDLQGGNGYNGMPDLNYTNQFGGTSSASPLVAGIMALGKQVAPAMDVRLAKHLLARNSDVVDENDATDTSDEGWKANAAGIRFNQNYGFGRINAGRFVAGARLTQSVSPISRRRYGPFTIGEEIPDNNAEGVTRSVVANDTLPLEEVSLYVRATHTYSGDIQVYLTSPSGRKVRMIKSNLSASAANLAWTYVTNAFWGETPTGEWKINVSDREGLDTGTWDSYFLDFRMGHRTSRLGSTLAVHNTATRANSYLALNNGRPTTSAITAVSPEGWTPVLYLDFNRDGLTDVLHRNAANALSVQILKDRESFGFLAVGNSGANQVIGNADADLDGDQDLVVFNPTTRVVGIQVITGGTIASYRTIGTLDAGRVARGVGDFTEDGRFDILVDDTNTRRILAWELNGDRLPVSVRNMGSLLTGYRSNSVGDLNIDGQPDVLLISEAGVTIGAMVNNTTVASYVTVAGSQGAGRVVRLAPF